MTGPKYASMRSRWEVTLGVGEKVEHQSHDTEQLAGDQRRNGARHHHRFDRRCHGEQDQGYASNERGKPRNNHRRVTVELCHTLHGLVRAASTIGLACRYRS